MVTIPQRMAQFMVHIYQFIGLYIRRIHHFIKVFKELPHAQCDIPFTLSGLVTTGLGQPFSKWLIAATLHSISLKNLFYRQCKIGIETRSI